MPTYQRVIIVSVTFLLLALICAFLPVFPDYVWMFPLGLGIGTLGGFFTGEICRLNDEREEYRRGLMINPDGDISENTLGRTNERRP